MERFEGFADAEGKISKLTKWLIDACKTSAALVEWLAFATA